jgi:hypothetical protein
MPGSSSGRAAVRHGLAVPGAVPKSVARRATARVETEPRQRRHRSVEGHAPPWRSGGRVCTDTYTLEGGPGVREPDARSPRSRARTSRAVPRRARRGLRLLRWDRPTRARGRPEATGLVPRRESERCTRRVRIDAGEDQGVEYGAQSVVVSGLRGITITAPHNGDATRDDLASEIVVLSLNPGPKARRSHHTDWPNGGSNRCFWARRYRMSAGAYREILPDAKISELPADKEAWTWTPGPRPRPARPLAATRRTPHRGGRYTTR